MRPVYVVSGGISKFAKARHDLTIEGLVKEAVDRLVSDISLEYPKFIEVTDMTVASYFSDHFMRQLMAGIMPHGYLGLTPKPTVRIEGGGATGGLGIQEGWKAVASGLHDVVLVYGFEMMSHVLTWKGNEFIALASDVSWDYPVGGFYTGYYAMMVVRHMMEFGTTHRDMAHVAVKNHKNAKYNPYSQAGYDITLEDVENSEVVSWPLTRYDICQMSDGSAAMLLASEEGLKKLQDAGASLKDTVKITGVGRGSDLMRMADRPHWDVILLPNEEPKDYEGSKFIDGKLKYPGVHSFRAGRMASKTAYEMANITDPLAEIDFVELHDAYSSSEIQTYEDMGLCKYGEGGEFARSGKAFLPTIDYGLDLPDKSVCAVNPSGGLIGFGHPVGASGIMQGVMALWQLQHRIGEKFGNDTLQVKEAKRGAIHSHAGTGTYVTVTILEREE